MSLVELANQDGRQWVKIGDCYGVTKKPRDLDVRTHVAIPFIPMELVPQGGAYEPSFVMKSPDSMSSGTYFECGDVLVAKITPSFENGKQALVQSLPLPFGYATTEVIPLHPLAGRNDDPRLLFFYLLHPDIRNYVAERMEGSTGRQRVPENVLLDIPIPELTPDEQRLAADALELIQKAISAENTAARNTSELKQATMRELFTRGLRGEAQKETEIGLVPASWNITRLDEVVLLQRGFDLPTSERKFGNITVFGSNGPVGFHNKPANKVPCPTVMVGRSGSVGKVSYSEVPCWPLNTTLYAKEYFGNIPKYIRFWLEYFDLSKFGQGVSVPTLNRNTFGSIFVSAPTVEEQADIVKVLEAIEKKIALHKQKRAVLIELFRSLLHKLMIGEICVSELNLTALSSTEVRV